MIASAGKTRITIMLDDDVIEFFRARAEERGGGYQILINAALRVAMEPAKAAGKADKPITAAMLRKILREELRAA